MAVVKYLLNKFKFNDIHYVLGNMWVKYYRYAASINHKGLQEKKLKKLYDHLKQRINAGIVLDIYDACIGKRFGTKIFLNCISNSKKHTLSRTQLIVAFR